MTYLLEPFVWLDEDTGKQGKDALQPVPHVFPKVLNPATLHG